METVALSIKTLAAAAGLGVAGNFAGHLEQAGEAADFVSVDAAAEAPKGVFPWYVPGREDFLGVFPLSADALACPAGEDLQIEPEAGIVCDVHYEGDRVAALRPALLTAFNDCSIRRPGAPKISHKKNWGANSKGIAATAFAIDALPPSGLRLASFLRRDGETHAYGIDSPLAGYSYYGERLLDWIVERLNGQAGSPDTPLEPCGAYLAEAGRPARAVIGIGATRYTTLGETTYLEPGDEAVVVVYDEGKSRPEDVADAVGARHEDTLPAASVLVQQVSASPSR